jgi:hypothetical protein
MSVAVSEVYGNSEGEVGSMNSSSLTPQSKV